MKALSIIALVVSVVGILFSIGVMELTESYELAGEFHTKSNQTAVGLGFLLLVCCLFMLAYSIVGTIKAFKKSA